MMIGYAQGVPAIVERVDAACDKLGLPRDNAFMNSTLGRVYGRALDALINVDMMVDQLQEMTDRIRNGENLHLQPGKMGTGNLALLLQGRGLGGSAPRQPEPLGAD